MTKVVDEAIAANVALIKSIPSQYADKVEAIILKGLQEGKPSSAVAEDIKALGGVTDRRARMIARDQLGKINSRISQIRQQKLGITHYRWRTARDERVRAPHRLREGDIIAWDDPPADGHAGQPINCRCTAEPYVDHLIDPDALTPEEAVKIQAKAKAEKAQLAKNDEKVMVKVLGRAAYDQYLADLKAKPIVVERQDLFGLSDGEIVAIRAYTDSHYYDLNRVLRGDTERLDATKISDLKLFADMLSSGLRKLPSVQGTMRRDVVLKESILDQFASRIGKKAKFTAFTSSANTRRQVMEGKFNCRMEIESKSGKSIVDFSVHGRKEGEVIFDRGAEFVIKSVVQDRKKKSVTVILLDESTEIQ